jgi:hypothetical protein
MSRQKISMLVWLKSLGAYDGDWPEGSVIVPPGYGFVYTSRGMRLHLTEDGGDYQALCGVGVNVNLGNEEVFASNVEENMCVQCLRALEQEEQS